MIIKKVGDLAKIVPQSIVPYSLKSLCITQTEINGLEYNDPYYTQKGETGFENLSKYIGKNIILILEGPNCRSCYYEII